MSLLSIHAKRGTALRVGLGLALSHALLGIGPYSCAGRQAYCRWASGWEPAVCIWQLHLEEHGGGDHRLSP
eukprot:8044022-Alexandrium_andersonii.AAC.1